MSVEQSEPAFGLDALTEITFQGAKWTRHLMTAACEGCGETIKNQDAVLTRSSSLRHSRCPTEDAQSATETENARRSNLKVRIPSEISKLLPSNLKDGTEPERVLSFLEWKVHKLGGSRPGMGMFGSMSRRAYLDPMMRGSNYEGEAYEAWSDDDEGSDDGRGPDDDEGSQGMNREDLMWKLESAHGSLQRQMEAKEPVTVNDTMLSRGWSEQRFSPTYGKKVCSLPACPQKKTTLGPWEHQPTLEDHEEAVWVDQTERLFLHQQCFQTAMNNDYMYQAETDTAVDEGSDTETED